jgi:hypothetical protein
MARQGLQEKFRSTLIFILPNPKYIGMERDSTILETAAK